MTDQISCSVTCVSCAMPIIHRIYPAGVDPSDGGILAAMGAAHIAAHPGHELAFETLTLEEEEARRMAEAEAEAQLAAEMKRSIEERRQQQADKLKQTTEGDAATRATAHLRNLVRGQR